MGEFSPHSVYSIQSTEPFFDKWDRSTSVTNVVRPVPARSYICVWYIYIPIVTTVTTCDRWRRVFARASLRGNSLSCCCSWASSPRQSFGRNETHPTAKRGILFWCRDSEMLMSVCRPLNFTFLRCSEGTARCKTSFLWICVPLQELGVRRFMTQRLTTLLLSFRYFWCIAREPDSLWIFFQDDNHFLRIFNDKMWEKRVKTKRKYERHQKCFVVKSIIFSRLSLKRKQNYLAQCKTPDAASKVCSLCLPLRLLRQSQQDTDSYLP
jgi:hypothetical protein